MKLLAVALVFVLLTAAASAASESKGGAKVSGLYGEPEVMKFRDGKVGAFSMGFDDSMISQADTVIPLLNARGLTATFYVNPGSHHYAQRRETWEVICPKSGLELANHTWHHEGAKDLKEADYEIGEASRSIWKLYPQRSKLLTFARGGATTWGPTREEIQTITDRYFLVRRPRGTTIGDADGSAAKITSFPQQAIDEKTWVPVYFHGVGGEWLPTNAQAFVTLLDFLVAHRDQLWIVGDNAGYKYEQERDSVSKVALSNATERGFALTLECDPSKVQTFGRPFLELYDEPLTVRVPVPESWQRFEVKQGRSSQQRGTIQVDGRRVAQFEARPNAGAATVTAR